MLLQSWKITCATSKPRISDSIRTEGTGRRVEGGSNEHEATGAFGAEGPMLVGAYVRGKIAFGPLTVVRGLWYCKGMGSAVQREQEIDR